MPPSAPALVLRALYSLDASNDRAAASHHLEYAEVIALRPPDTFSCHPPRPDSPEPSCRSIVLRLTSGIPYLICLATATRRLSCARARMVFRAGMKTFCGVSCMEGRWFFGGGAR